jgi:hypothetical protein
VRLRILIATAIGLASGFLCWLLMARLQLGAGDFTWAIRAAQDLLARRNPYSSPLQLYPLPAAVFGLPFMWMRPEIAAGIFYGSSTALLAFGLSRERYHRLLIFLAYPYWAGILTAQWPPLIMASAFFPLLLPATLAKPQIGLPVALTRFSRRGAIACAAVLLLSLAIAPKWPWLWMANAAHYERFVPLLVFPGFLLALAPLRHRDRDAMLLLLMAITPQRWFYDSFILWLIPKTRRAIVGTVFFSWVPGIWRWYHTPHTYHEVGRWSVCFIYLPMLVVVLMRSFGSSVKSDPRDLGFGAGEGSLPVLNRFHQRQGEQHER